MKKDKTPAFPAIFETENATGNEGMYLRDYFAAKAMEASLSSPELMEVVSAGDILDGSAFDRIAEKAYKMADAMLKQRML